MKKILTLICALAFVVALSTPVDAAYYFFQVKDEQGRAITSGFRCQIYTVASRTQDALFTGTSYDTAKTNPVNPDANGVCSFATSNSTVDVLIYGHSGTARGAIARVNDLTDKDHTIILDTQKSTKVIRFYYDSLLSKGAEVDTGIDLPIGAAVFDVWAEVASSVEVASVSVGLLSTESSGDTNGFCVSQGVDQTWGGIGASGSTTSWFRCEASRSNVTVQEGAQGQESFYYSSNTRGILIASYARGQNSLTGADTTAARFAESSRGMYSEHPHFVRPGAATSIVYQTNDRRWPSQMGTGLLGKNGYGGWIWLFYRELGWKK